MGTAEVDGTTAVRDAPATTAATIAGPADSAVPGGTTADPLIADPVDMAAGTTVGLVATAAIGGTTGDREATAVDAGMTGARAVVTAVDAGTSVELGGPGMIGVRAVASGGTIVPGTSVMSVPVVGGTTALVTSGMTVRGTSGTTGGRGTGLVESAAGSGVRSGRVRSGVRSGGTTGVVRGTSVVAVVGSGGTSGPVGAMSVLDGPAGVTSVDARVAGMSAVGVRVAGTSVGAVDSAGTSGWPGGGMPGAAIGTTRRRPVRGGTTRRFRRGSREPSSIGA
nr:hypothetical protein [Kribbella amoyensis]